MVKKYFFILYGVAAALLMGALYLYMQSIESTDEPTMMNGRTEFNESFTQKMYDALIQIADTMTEPKPGEWLYEMGEKGQTFEEFVKGQWERPDSKYRKIYLQPLGTFSGNNCPDVKLLKQFTESFFMMPVTVLPVIDVDTLNITSRENPYTFNRQLLTTSILDYLEMRFPSDAYCLAAVTIQDLYPEPSWNFVFGQASLIRRVGVFSFARYDPAFLGQRHNLSPDEITSLILWRSCKVLSHEIGHMFGLYHCIYYRCGMNGSNSLEESDSKPVHLCPVCLKKLQYSIGFDIAKRYEKLREFYNMVGFEEEKEAIERRLIVVQN